MPTDSPAAIAFDQIARWAVAAEQDWRTLDPHGKGSGGAPRYGTYGTGYDGWGVQTQQKYAATLAAVAMLGGRYGFARTDWALERALAALRFNLDSHKSGQLHCTDGSRWGHSWISALGIERMLFGVQLLEPQLTDSDRQALRRVLASEADWLLYGYERSGKRGICAGLWGRDGSNDPESNIWNGALLWRAAHLCEGHPHAALWRERACEFFASGVSIEADALDNTVWDGKPLRERYIGANFFPNYTLDHHAYLNVGYMVICLSNAAMLHLDFSAAGLELPQLLYLHQQDLWQVVRQLVFDNGRLIRIGGDTRVRYAYCQEYLLPARLFATHKLGDRFALDSVPAQLEWIAQERDAGADDYFYSRRLADLRSVSPLYYTRLESDRSCALAMLATYWDLATEGAAKTHSADDSGKATRAGGFGTISRAEDSAAATSRTDESAVAHSAVTVSGNGADSSVVQVGAKGTGWAEPRHGAAFHRSPSRFASFAWRASDLAQGLCLSPADGHLAEWQYNLAGVVEFCHHAHPQHGQIEFHRRFNDCHVDSFDGGFITCGSLWEGVNLKLAESWSGTDSALHQIAFAALPDGHTVLCLQHCRMGGRRGYIAAAQGMHLNIPCDILNHNTASLRWEAGGRVLHTPAAQEAVEPLGSRWANVNERVGVVGLYGAQSLHLDRSHRRRGGNLDSLYVERLHWGFAAGPFCVEAGETILDVGWACLASVDAAQTQVFASANAGAALDVSAKIAAHATGGGGESLRTVSVKAMDGQTYLLITNFGEHELTLREGFAQSAGFARLECLAQGRAPEPELLLMPAQARVFRVSLG